MRLTEKTIVTSNDGTTRVKRRHDQAQIPFDRLCATAAIWPNDRELPTVGPSAGRTMGSDQSLSAQEGDQ
jgi:hypothetical protein